MCVTTLYFIPIIEKENYITSQHSFNSVSLSLSLIHALKAPQICVLFHIKGGTSSPHNSIHNQFLKSHLYLHPLHTTSGQDLHLQSCSQQVSCYQLSLITRLFASPHRCTYAQFFSITSPRFAYTFTHTTHTHTAINSNPQHESHTFPHILVWMIITLTDSS